MTPRLKTLAVFVLTLACLAVSGLEAEPEQETGRRRQVGRESRPTRPHAQTTKVRFRDIERVSCDATGTAESPYAVGVNCRTIEVDGYPREYLVYVPPDSDLTQEAHAPVVLVFHGGSQTGGRFLRMSGWREKADEVGLIAVFPTALRHYLLEEDRWATQWNDYYLPAEADLGRRPAEYPATAPWPADDVGFVRAMLDDLEAMAHADPERLYATGFSNGAAFTYRLAIEATDRLAAFAFVGGRFCDPVQAHWTTAPPRPAYMVVGAIDSKLLGQHIGIGDPLPPDVDALLDVDPLVSCLEAPLEAFELAWEPYETREPTGSTHVEWSTPLGPPRRSTFRFAVLRGLGHRYPNGDNNPLGWRAADRFWEFFSDLRLQENGPANQDPGGSPHDPPTGSQVQTTTVRFRSVDRTVSFYVPSSYQEGTPIPLVFALHGGSGDASVMYHPNKGIVEYAEDQGFVAVFPNGLPKAGAPASSTKYFWSDPVNVPYMDHLMDLMTETYTVDAERIYFIGFSGGAQLIYKLAADPTLSERIAAIATVAGGIGMKPTDPVDAPWEIIELDATESAPMPALLLQGGADTKAPEHGGFSQDFGKIVLSFPMKVDIWRLVVGTGRRGESVTLPLAPPHVVATRYRNPVTGHAVVAAVDPSLPHKWPQWDFMGAIWDFFERSQETES